MGIVPLTRLDQIVVQFSSGQAHQLKKPGEIEGAHLVEVEYLVDDATGAVMGRTNNPLNGHAQPLEPAKVADVIGGQFATVAAQLADTQKQLADANAGLNKAAKDIAERDATIASITAAHQDASSRNAAAIAALSAPAAKG